MLKIVITMVVTNSRLDLGHWEQIYYSEFDGQRQKRVLVKVRRINPSFLVFSKAVRNARLARMSTVTPFLISPLVEESLFT